jgi:tetratricopeptide (TPR) repeat protein
VLSQKKLEEAAIDQALLLIPGIDSQISFLNSLASTHAQKGEFGKAYSILCKLEGITSPEKKHTHKSISLNKGRMLWKMICNIPGLPASHPRIKEIKDLFEPAFTCSDYDLKIDAANMKLVIALKFRQYDQAKVIIEAIGKFNENGINRENLHNYYYNCAEIYRNLFKFAAAREYAKKANIFLPDQLDLIDLLIEIEILDGNHKAAKAGLDRLSRLFHDNPAALACYVNYLINILDDKKAYELSKELMKNYGNQEFFRKKVVTELITKREANSTSSTISEKQKETENRSLPLLNNGDLQDLHTLMHFIQRSYSDWQSDEDLQILRSSIKKALNYMPNYLLFNYYAGCVAANLDDINEAANYFEKVIKVTPDSVEINYYLGIVYYFKGKEYFELAKKHLHFFLEKEPGSAHAHIYFMIGVIYGCQGDAITATKYTDIAIQLDPKYSLKLKLHSEAGIQEAGKEDNNSEATYEQKDHIKQQEIIEDDSYDVPSIYEEYYKEYVASERAKSTEKKKLKNAAKHFKEQHVEHVASWGDEYPTSADKNVYKIPGTKNYYVWLDENAKEIKKQPEEVIAETKKIISNLRIARDKGQGGVKFLSKNILEIKMSGSNGVGDKRPWAERVKNEHGDKLFPIRHVGKH